MKTLTDTLLGIYPLGEWILYFFCYCFLGWIWECTYDWICEKHFINRGFMYGPCIPIYGSGALLILIITLPFRGRYLLMAIVSMAAASVLELGTGMAMEAIFKVRYWDYSMYFANVRGYICLSSTLAWGVLSMLLVYVIQPALEKMVSGFAYVWIVRADALLMAVAAADFALSFKAAIDLRDVLARTEKLREEINTLRERIAMLQKQIAETVSEAKSATIEKASDAKHATIGYAAVARARAERELSELKLRERFSTEKLRSFATDSVRGILRRNPGAVSNIYKEAFDTVKNVIKGAFRENIMAEQIEERFVSGFCKAQNQTRTVLCEYEQGENTQPELVETDCAYGACEHQDACILMKEALGQK